MTDLRQGVTPGAHDVLDKLDELRPKWEAVGAVGRRLNAPIDVQRDELVLRAARAIYEVEAIDPGDRIVIRYIITTHASIAGVGLSKVGHWGGRRFAGSVAARAAAIIDADGRPHVIEEPRPITKPLSRISS